MATILIIDDQPTNRDYLVTLLGYGGHRLLEAPDGAAGLDLARAKRPELIITDLVVPTMDGYELARQVRADPMIGATQIIFYSSSYLAAEVRRLAEACGVAYVLTKPTEPETILNTVSIALDAEQIPPIRPVPDEFHHQQMHLVTNTLKKKVEELEARIAECNQINEQLASFYLLTRGNTPLPTSTVSGEVNEAMPRPRTITAPFHAPLSPREVEVLSMVAKGLTNREMAEQLAISVRTVERHRSSIMRKLKLRNRAELVSYAVRRDFLAKDTRRPAPAG